MIMVVLMILTAKHFKVVAFLVCILTILCSCIPAFASSSGFSDSPVMELDSSELVPSEDSTLVSLKASPVTPQNSNGFHQVIISLLGNYEPITVDYEYRNNNNTYYSHNISTTPDWSWIASAFIFVVIIYCLFRLVGGLFSCK